MEPKFTIAIISLIIIVILLVTTFRKKNSYPLPSISATTGVKPVVMIIIDSLMDLPLLEAIHSDKAPALKFLKEKGQYFPRMVTSFPTMSVCIDTTILTGVRPNQHHIFGLTFLHRKENRVINFGTGPKETFAFGLKQFLADSMLNLNQQFLNKDVKTIHEEYEGQTASINAVIYRGKTKHFIRPPWLASFFGLLPKKIETKGPSILTFGSMLQIDPNTDHGQPWFRYGFNDKFSRMELVSLINKNLLPPFTLVYFPGNDNYVHRKGVSEIKGIQKADQELQKVLNAFPNWDEAIKKVTFIILGDSGQTNTLPDQKQAFIDLRKVLKNYSIMPIGQKTPQSKDQIVLCINERMAYVYIHDENLSTTEVVQQLKQESSLDIIAWREKDGFIHVVSGQNEGHLKFRSQGEFLDEYGETWELIGDLSMLDLTVDEQKQIQFGVYPDALFRLAGVMDTADSVIVLTVQTGYEMVGQSTPKHKGASHGSLHQLDSLVPMIVAGTDSAPKHLRLIHLKDWVLELIKPIDTPHG